MSGLPAGDGVIYRERLSPSLWFLVAAAVCGPMAALVLAPFDTTVALIGGAIVGVGAVALLIAGSPTIAVAHGEFIAGRAHIDAHLLGEPEIFTGDDARLARGRDLDPRAWHIVRGGIDGVLRIPVLDEDDPAPVWIVSTRTPDRLAAAIRRARQVTPRTPRR